MKIKYVAIQKVAEDMGVSTSWLRKLVNRAHIDYYQEKGAARGRVLLNIESLNTYFHKNQIHTS